MYQIICNKLFEGHEDIVNKFIEEGYLPLGGPIYVQGFGFCQAMIRREVMSAPKEQKEPIEKICGGCFHYAVDFGYSGDCKRYPKSIAVEHTHWCGEWMAKRTNRVSGRVEMSESVKVPYESIARIRHNIHAEPVFLTDTEEWGLLFENGTWVTSQRLEAATHWYGTVMMVN